MGDVNIIVAVISALFGTGGIGTALYAWRKDARQGPIDAETAKIANAAALSDVATNWVSYQDQKMKEQDEKIRTQGEMIDQLNVKFDNVHSKLMRWAAWYDHLLDRWAEHREQLKPPAPPSEL